VLLALAKVGSLDEAIAIVRCVVVRCVLGGLYDFGSALNPGS
jgi:hypothetical protein